MLTKFQSFIRLEAVFLFLIVVFFFIFNYFKLASYPPGLYIDEVAIGVNAYSILTKGEDEYGTKWPIYFRSYGEYKLPVYIYLTAISMGILGKNEYALRFPSLAGGTLSLLVFYFILKHLKQKTKFALLATFLLAVTQWYTHFIGAAFEASTALFFYLLAILLYLYYRKKENNFIFVFIPVILLFSAFSYYAYKVIASISLIYIIFDSFINKNKKAALFISIILLSYLGHIFSSNEVKVRFIQTTALTSYTFENIAEIVRNYISYFSFDFLYRNGDGINRHLVVSYGILPKWTVVFLIPGIIYLIKKIRERFSKFIFMILFLAPLPACLAYPSPHVLRSFLLVIPFVLIITIGLDKFIFSTNKIKKLKIIGVCLLFIFEFSHYIHLSLFHYSKTALIDWGANYKEVVKVATSLKEKYSIIVLSESMFSAKEYFSFYNQFLHPVSVKADFDKKSQFGSLPVLYITSDTSGVAPSSHKLIETVYLPNINHNIFAQFWEL